MKLTRDQVEKVAKLANLPIEESAIDRSADQLSKILDYIDQLRAVDTDNTDPIYDVSTAKNVMRGDEVGESLTQEEALKNGPNIRDGFFVTKGVFEEE